jgi:hypothetical protein
MVYELLGIFPFSVSYLSYYFPQFYVILKWSTDDHMIFTWRDENSLNVTFKERKQTLKEYYYADCGILACDAI